MLAYVLKRLIAGFMVVVMISMMVYALFWYGPKSPAKPLCDSERSRGCDPATIERYEAKLGFNNPIHEEYGKWAKGPVAGRTITVGSTDIQCDAPCLGLSNRNRQPVFEQLVTKIPATVSLACGAAFLYLAVGVTVGVMAARRRGSFADTALVSTSLFMTSIPYYLVALIVMLYTNRD